MSFETEAQLSLTIPRSELQNVQQQIEDSIGTVDVGATDGGSMSAQTTGASGGGRGGRRVMRLAEERNEHLDDISIYLESVEDTLSEGGLLGGDGGGFGGIITELAGAGAETAGDVAIEAGDQVAEAIQDTLVGTVSTALGTSVSNAINGSEVDVADTTVPVTPNPLPVSGGGGGGGTTVSPQFDPTFKPTLDVAPEFDLPDLEFGSPGTVRVDESQLPLPVDREPLPVEDVGPISVVVEARGVGGSGRRSSEGVSFGQRLRDFARTVPGGDGVADVSRRGTERIFDIIPGVDSSDVGRGSQGRSTTSQPVGSTVEVTHSPTYNMEVDPRRFDQLVTDVVDELEKRIERDIDEIRDDLETVESDLSDLERNIRSSGR